MRTTAVVAVIVSWRFCYQERIRMLTAQDIGSRAANCRQWLVHESRYVFPVDAELSTTSKFQRDLGPVLGDV